MLGGEDRSEHPKVLSLSSLEVRPIFAHERYEWDSLMGQYHYLGLRNIVGESVRYVALLERRWVALIGWGTAAFKNRHRDAWIGWSPEIQWQRLKLIANNVRFLILDGMPNLASKVLSLNLKRLSEDWQATYGHPIFLAETFVDSSRFKGTCYKASGWLCLGDTRGFRRNAGKYYHHGQPKAIYIRPLRRDAARVLSDPLSNPKLKEVGIMNIGALSPEAKDSLIEHLQKIPEPRKAKGIRHKKISVLALSVCAILSGARGFAAIAEWAALCSQNMLQRFWCRRDPRTKRYIPPSEPTIRRVLQQIDSRIVDTVVSQWLLTRVCCNKGDVVAIDGKTLKGARIKNDRKLHLLSAFLQREGVVIAQQEVDMKSNEITAVQPMLENTDIQGMVVTADALHTQKETARFIVEEKGADYFFYSQGQPSHP
jgi:hypothetical protein